MEQRPALATLRRAGERAHSQTPLLLAVSFGLGLSVAAFWFGYGSKREARTTPAAGLIGAQVSLSPATRAILDRLEAPVELRFYAVLDPATVSAPELAFAGRVDRLLSAYEAAGHGKVTLVRIQERQGSGKTAADADGVKPFNLENGFACFLGLAIACNGQKESLPRLLPEWESAVEPDVSRAIARVRARPSAIAPSVASPPDPSVVAELRRLLPHLDTISLEEGTEILRQAEFEKFASAANDAAGRVSEAKQRLNQARQGSSEAEQQAAMQHLQQIEAEQGQKLQELKDIAARSHALVQALQRIKSQPR